MKFFNPFMFVSINTKWAEERMGRLIFIEHLYVPGTLVGSLYTSSNLTLTVRLYY